MSMIYGLITRGDYNHAQVWLSGMNERAGLWPADYVAESGTGRGSVAIRERSTSEGAPANGFAQDDRYALVLDGRIHNQAELLLDFGQRSASDAELALQSYKKWGEGFASHLIGEFALALFDKAENAVTLVRDALGVRPLFYAESEHHIAFASNMDVLRRLPFVDHSPDADWIVDYLELVKSDCGGTAYKGIKSLRPAESVSFSGAGRKCTQHWTPPAQDSELVITLDEAVAEYRRLFDQAVVCRLPEKGPVGCELSGGMDSCSIAVTAAPAIADRGERLITLSHIVGKGGPHGAQVADESEQVEQVLAFMPPTDHHWLGEERYSQLPTLARTVELHGGPQRRDFGSGQPLVADIMQSEDCRVLLSGHGGDQCATSFAAGYTHSLALAREWSDLDNIAGPRSRWFWRFGLGRVILRRRLTGFQAATLQRRQRITSPDHISDGDLLRRKLEFPDRPAWGTINERERQVIVSAHVAQRTQDSAVGSGPYGFAHSYPMLDRRLVDFCLKVPGLLKRSPSQTRNLIRGAMMGRLPEPIRLRDQKRGANSVPVAVSGFYKSIPEYRQLFVRHLDDPSVTAFVNLRMLIQYLDDLAADRQPVHGLKNRQIRRAAQFCFWSTSSP